MTLTKMHDILSHLYSWGVPHGMVGATGGGEIYFEFSSQPERTTDQYLRSRGFIYHDGLYIYRPCR